MASKPLRWYIRAQLGVLLLPAGLCLFGEAVSRRIVQMLGQDRGPWFWYGTLSVIALGDEMAGLWSNNDALAEALDAAAQTGGEGLWRMPLRQSYRDGLKSLLADMKNTGPRPGGSITAALFLKEFVAKDTAWAHIDIAGPVWSDKGKGVNPAGATGYGVRTLVNWVLAQS